MENVVAFNNELSGLYESKPPISKAKMAAITKAAMRAIKFYKHVVQSVEKFILKCKPEYKVPGLYVIDSIVRQSRHQFGVEKDVFAARFARNMKDTFANLFRCAPEDKSRIIRVLNLWQKNNVFAPEVIQPIFDLADPNHPIYSMQPQLGLGGSAGDISTNGMNVSSGGLDVSGTSGGSGGGGVMAGNQSGVDDKLVLPDLSIGHPKAQTNALDQSTIRQLQQIQQLLIRQTATDNATSTSSGCGGIVGVMSQSDSIKFNKKLLDYDYGDEDEEENKSTSPHVPNLLDNNNLKQLLKDPNVLRQLQTLQNFQKFKQQEEKQHKLNELRMQEEAFEKHIQNVLKGTTSDVADISGKEVEFVSEESKIEVINLDGNDSRSPTPDRDRYKRRRSRSRSRSRERLANRDRRRRSRSRSRSRSPRTNRRRTSREREGDRERRAERNRDKEKEKEREHERERRRKGLPDLKKDHLSVCSTTLWVGHLSKLVYQEELSDTFGKYGDIVSIDQIVPRGCAFIVMNRRQDASKAMSALKNHKLQGRAITISWAAGKGVKSKEWKDFWDLELGVTYIPWDKLESDTDLDALEEGGMFDEDSMPEWMKDKINNLKNIKDNIASGGPAMMFGIDGMPKIDTTQPPPQAAGMMPMAPFTMAPPMGGPPRMMPPMGVPMPGNMVSGIPMPPTMVPGMPPPHAMMMPQGMIPPPGYPPIPQLDKNIPPPNMRGDANMGGMPPGGFMGNPGLMPPMAIATHPFQHQPPNAGGNASSDDQMDIEMEDDMATDAPQLNFNQPPPMFQGGGGFPDGMPPGAEGGGVDEFVGRDRNRGGGSRWGAREDRGERSGNRGDGPESEMWRENGNGPNFNDNQRRGGGPPGSLPPFDMNAHPPRDAFFDMRNNGADDFNDRRGGGGRVGGGAGGDFFPNNMQNRFNQPNSLMQMRIQPPPVFNNRMGGPGMGPGGPGMFMRGQGPRSQGGQQGGGFNFNDRPPFERDMDGGGGGGGGDRMRGGRGMNDRRGGGRGGGRGRGGGPNNWRDNDDDEEGNGNGNVFKRRGPNRFGRDRDGPDDNRMSRDRDRMPGGRRGNDRNSRERMDRSRERRGGGEGSGNDRSRNRKMSSEQRDEPPTQSKQSNKDASNLPLDTEEDWDQELSEHNFESGQRKPSPQSQKQTEHEKDEEAHSTVNDDNNGPSASPKESNEPKEFTAPIAASRDEPQPQQPSKKEERTNSVNTPLYDEPAPPEHKPTATDKDFEVSGGGNDNGGDGDIAVQESNVENISEESGPPQYEEAPEE